MEIKDQCVVALTWTLTDTLGEVLDTLDAPVEFFVGGQDLLARIDAALLGKKTGDALQLQLEPEDAFGDYHEGWLFLEPRTLFPDSLEEGMIVEGSALPPGCNPEAPRELFYTVTEIYPEHVVLDGNHPLAGMALRLQLTVRGVREATVDEVGRGSAGTGFFRLQASEGGSPTLH